jgi:hypothetical protein
MAKKEGSWSGGLHYCLERIETPYVILLLEDFFLNQKVKHNKVMEFLELMKADPSIKCLRLVPVPAPSEAINEELGRYVRGEAYRISTQMAIWEKNYLKQIAEEGESPWEFEQCGSVRSENVDGEIYGVLDQKPKDRVMTHLNGIIRGKLTRQSLRFLNQENINVENLPVNSKLEEFYWFRAPGIIRKALDYINTNLRSIMWKEKL